MGNGAGREGDDGVGDLYRSLSRERPPPRLDDQVLRHAREAAQTRRVAWPSWLRPAAAVAVFGVSVALVAGQYGQWGDAVPAEGSSVVENFGDAAQRSETRMREIGDNVTPQTQNPEPLPAASYRIEGAPPGVRCSRQQTESRAAWEDCIEALAAAGEEDAAAEERRRLQNAFPD